PCLDQRQLASAFAVDEGHFERGPQGLFVVDDSRLWSLRRRRRVCCGPLASWTSWWPGGRVGLRIVVLPGHCWPPFAVVAVGGGVCGGPGQLWGCRAGDGLGPETLALLP